MPLPSKPEFRILVNGSRDITNAAGDRLIELRVNDEAGAQADTAEIRLDNRDGRITLPPRGADLEISFGWGSEKLTKTGRYTVDEFELSGPPDTLAIRAKAADMYSGLKAHKTRSWDDVSIRDLVSGIAADHGLEPRVGNSLSGVRIPHLDQTEESDLHLLTRLARDYDAVAKPASGRLLFVPQGQAESASGQTMPVVQILPYHLRDWRVTLADRGDYGAVQAHWREDGSATRTTEKAGDRDPVYILQRLYASATEAREAARAKLAELARGTRALAASLSRGSPVLAAEAIIELQGFPKGVDRRWICTHVTHVLTGRGGYTTSVQATP